MDELAERLRRTDPLPPDWSPHPPDGPAARSLLEDIVNTPLEPAGAAPAGSHSRWYWLGGGAVAAAAAVVGVLVLTADDAAAPQVAVVVDTATAPTPTDPVTPTTVPAPTGSVPTYQLAPSDPTISMCLALSEFQPDPSAVAFGGTVTAIEGDAVRVAVDRWYANGDAPEVELAVEPDMPVVALDGVEFVEDQRYLVSVFDGVVGICGVSGPASPELETFYDQWYG
ncbi:MAG: hypothetical protein H0U21_06930 [Acidimicrobiia bacterium]|nr:hypothetical protein [Acidimicrobiia bacterium]